MKLVKLNEYYINPDNVIYLQPCGESSCYINFIGGGNRNFSFVEIKNKTPEEVADLLLQSGALP